MRIVTWNVNSIRTRLPRLLGVLARHQPDVVCLQELKVVDENFPTLDVKQAGYHSTIVGQKTYNGVAILSKEKPDNIATSMADGTDDPQARFVAADVSGVRVISVYVPNGGSVGSDKWDYKLEWLARLSSYLEAHGDPAKPLAVCGDFNIAPDDHDVNNPERWKDSVLCHPEGRAAFRKLINWGLVDAFRAHHPDGGIFSWWDYRMLGFPKNDGLRIDGLLVTQPLADHIANAFIDRDERKGKQPSDHAPVVVDFTI
jgi:exodeoxyribonuclease-3